MQQALASVPNSHCKSPDRLETSVTDRYGEIQYLFHNMKIISFEYKRHIIVILLVLKGVWGGHLGRGDCKFW